MRFHRPEGWRPSLPEVLVRDDVTQALGSAIVNYEALESLYGDGFGLNRPKMPVTRLKQFVLNQLPQDFIHKYGRYWQIGNTISVDPIAIREYLYDDTPTGITRVLAHEDAHRRDYIDYPVLARFMAEELEARALAVGNDPATVKTYGTIISFTEW